GPVQAGDAQALSEREREVLQWLALGKKQAEVAAILMISERTVEKHLRAARRHRAAQALQGEEQDRAE
ncbi:LuxR C-terminal-related transcriptional regulator, partial [Pseudomonas aeruginosa]